MDPQFWHERWENNQIGFHEGEANAMLVAHFDVLEVPKDGRVFVPLCGKTRDIAWLLDKGHRVAGAELSETAVGQLFDELGITPSIARAGALKHHSGPGIDIYTGDIFDLDRAVLGPVDAVYDRAALVALPDDLRARYAAHLGALTRQAPQLLITFDYDQTVMPGPPFSVPGDVVTALYDRAYEVGLLAATPVAGNLKGIAPAHELAWHLR